METETHVQAGNEKAGPGLCHMKKEAAAPSAETQEQAAASPSPAPAPDSHVFPVLLDLSARFQILLLLQLLGHLQVVFDQAVALDVRRQVMLDCNKTQEEGQNQAMLSKGREEGSRRRR